MLRSLAVALETAAIAVIGIVALVKTAADGAVIAAALSAVSTLLVALLKRDGNHRSRALERIEAKVDASASEHAQTRGRLDAAVEAMRSELHDIRTDLHDVDTRVTAIETRLKEQS